MSNFKEVFDKIEVGMVLEIKSTDDGQTSLVMVLPNDRNELAISGPRHWFPLECLKNDNLSYYSSVLTKVYGRTNNRDAHTLSINDRKLIWSREEMRKKIDWKNVAMDTPIIIKSNGGTNIFTRHFAGYENGLVYYWANGKTHLTVDNIKSEKIPHSPEYAELHNKSITIRTGEIKAEKFRTDRTTITKPMGIFF